jgi:hypothetical protein
MGKTQKPLTILVHPSLVETPEFRTLAAQGHTITSDLYLESAWDADIVFGPNCWRMTPELLPYLDLAIKGARGVKYPKGKK